MKTIQKCVILFCVMLLSNLNFAQTAKELVIAATNKIKANDLSGAISDYSRAIELEPINANLYLERGNIKNKLKKFPDALADYNKSISINHDPNAYYARAQVKIELKDQQGTLDDLNLAYPAKKTNATFYYQRATCKEALKDYDGAILDLTKTIELNPDLIKAYFTRGVLRVGQDSKEEGCQDLQKAKELNYPEAAAMIEKLCN